MLFPAEGSTVQGSTNKSHTGYIHNRVWYVLLSKSIQCIALQIHRRHAFTEVQLIVFLSKAGCKPKAGKRGILHNITLDNVTFTLDTCDNL